MSLPNRIAAYQDCIDFFDAASASKHGARAGFATYGEANVFRLRCNQARALLAAEAQRIYDKRDPAWGKTDYDHLVVRMPRGPSDDGTWWTYIEPTGANILVIEKIEPEDAA